MTLFGHQVVVMVSCRATATTDWPDCLPAMAHRLRSPVWLSFAADNMYALEELRACCKVNLYFPKFMHKCRVWKFVLLHGTTATADDAVWQTISQMFCLTGGHRVG